MAKNKGMLNSQTGFSLMELLVVVALIGIVSAIAFRGARYIDSDRLKSASHQLYSDLQSLKQNAIMQSTVDTSRGNGLRFASNNSYFTFEFNDADNNYTYKSDYSEEKGAKQQNFSAQVTVTIGDTGNPVDNVLIFDKRGITRGTDWSTIGNQVYVLRFSGETQARCVQIDGVTIREGLWNGAICN